MTHVFWHQSNYMYMSTSPVYLSPLICQNDCQLSCMGGIFEAKHCHMFIFKLTWNWCTKMESLVPVKLMDWMAMHIKTYQNLIQWYCWSNIKSYHISGYFYGTKFSHFTQIWFSWKNNFRKWPTWTCIKVAWQHFAELIFATSTRNTKITKKLVPPIYGR